MKTDFDRLPDEAKAALIASRAWAKLEAETATELAAERAAEAAREAQAIAQQRREFQAIEGEAIAALKVLTPLYADRNAAAVDLAQAVKAYLAIESKIQAISRDAGQHTMSIAHFVNPTQRAEWIASLRQRAGLTAQHIDGLPAGGDEFQSAARVVCWLLSTQAIKGNTVSLDGDRSVTIP